MTTDIHFLRAKTLSKKTTRSGTSDDVLKRVMRHNLREIQSEFGERADSKIDAQRIRLNEVLVGLTTSDGVARLANDTMLTAGAAQRANAALGIEIVCSLPNGLKIDYRDYFRSAVEWAHHYFRIPILSAIVHNDEDYPHLHIVMLPMREGTLMGRNILGGRAETVLMHKNFHTEVGKKYGLRTPTPRKRYSAEVRHIATQQMRDYMREFSGFTNEAVDALIEILAKHPEDTLAALGLPMPVEPSKTVAGIFTRECGTDNAIALPYNREASRMRRENKKRYALIALPEPVPSAAPLLQDSANTLLIERSTTDVRSYTTTAGLGDNEPAPQAYQLTGADLELTGEPTERFTRERDMDRRSNEWNGDIGEWRKPSGPTSSKRATAAAQVKEALARNRTSQRNPDTP